MWFKQLQVFQLTTSIAYDVDQLSEQLTSLAFTPCLPTFPSSHGWAAPIEKENAPLVHAINGFTMLCLQTEEKVLPVGVINHELSKKVKQMEQTHERKIRQKEKQNLKDELMHTLLPRAFSKITRLYAYIDHKNYWLILNTANIKKADEFVSLLKRSLNVEVHPFDLKKLSPLMTHWLKHQSYPNGFSIEKSCMLQDPQQQKRIIRCQQQDLSASSIQALLKDGCEVKQLALNWQDRLSFIMNEDFSLRSIQYQDNVIAQAKEIDSETEQHRFDADFFIMTETLTGLLTDLLNSLLKTQNKTEEKTAMV